MGAITDGVDLNKLLVAHYGCTKWTVKKMDGGWQDLSFHAVNAIGEEFTFKVFIDVITSDQRRIEAEIELLTFLHSQGLPVPAIVPTLAGKMYGEALFGESTRRFRLATFIKGKVVDRTFNEGICKQFGHVVGRIDKALASFNHPLYDSRDQSNVLLQFFHWDIRKLIDKLPNRPRKIAKRYLAAYEEVVTANRELLPKQVIHDDLQGLNIVGNEEGSQVVGVIDFAGAMKSFRVIEPSVALAGIFVSDCDPFKCARAFLENYVEHSPLNEAELAALPITVAGRLVMCKTMLNEVAMTDPNYDHNSYHEHIYAASWYVVERLLDKKCSYRKFFDDFAEAVNKRKEAILQC